VLEDAKVSDAAELARLSRASREAEQTSP
jgi:hypothetical protein